MSEISKSYQGASVDGAQWLESNGVMNTQKLQKNLRLSESVGAMIAEEARRLTAATGRPWPKNAVVAGAMAIFLLLSEKTRIECARAGELLSVNPEEAR